VVMSRCVRVDRQAQTFAAARERTRQVEGAE
jgi:hypothetical protein